MRGEKWIFLSMGIVIGLLASIILLPSSPHIDSNLLNVILVLLLTLATLGCWRAAAESSKTAKQSHDYIKWINQPSIKLEEWKTWVTKSDFRMQYALSIKGKEPIILRNTNLTFFYINFHDVYEIENKYHICLYPNSDFSDCLGCELSSKEFTEEVKGWNPEDKEEVKQAKLSISGILFLHVEFTRKNDDQLISYDVVLYNFHVTDRLLHLDDYELLKHKIPKNFTRKLDQYFGL